MWALHYLFCKQKHKYQKARARTVLTILLEEIASLFYVGNAFDPTRHSNFTKYKDPTFNYHTDKASDWPAEDDQQSAVRSLNEGGLAAGGRRPLNKLNEVNK